MSKNSGAPSSSSRVLSLIPNNVRKTIDQIKEITGGNHSEEDIYAVLKDCSMDPNETTQRLLHLDTFHEVKRKRDKKKEAVRSKSGEESKWKSGHQGRGTRNSRRNSFSQYTTNDAGGRRIASIRKENGVEDSRDKGFRRSHALDLNEADAIQSFHQEKSSSIITNGPLELPNDNLSRGLGVQLSNMEEGHLSKEKVDVSADNASSTVPNISAGNPPSASSPVLLLPCDSWVSVVDSIKQEVRVQQIAETSSFVPAGGGIGTADFIKDIHLNQSEVKSVDVCQLSSSTNGKQLCELVKLAHPKISGDGPVADKSHGPDSVTDVKLSSPPSTDPLGVKDTTAKLEKLKFADGQHVIIPRHIQVPEAVKNVLNFGSLDASFGVRESCTNTEATESSNHVVDSAPSDTVGKLYPCDQDAGSTALQANLADHPPSTLCSPSQSSPIKAEVSSSDTVLKDGQPKQENLPAIGPPFPVVQTTPSYSFGFMPPLVASVLGQPQGFESQLHVVSSLGGTSTSTPPLTAAAQSTVGAPPQPIHVFRQHYPPNYLPYGHYFPPFYVPPTMHQYLGHTAFSPPLPSSMYLSSPAAAGTGMKISPANSKPGANLGNQVPLGVPSVYGAYGPSPVAYIQNATATSGNSSDAEDLGPSAPKESNIYLGQQSEGSAVWPHAGREAASFPFLNLPPHGPQHFLSPHSSHGGFTVYHTLQPMGSPAPGLPLLQQTQPLAGSVETVGPPANSYQQPQRQQPIN